jgi:hypothetical protein
MPDAIKSRVVLRRMTSVKENRYSFLPPRSGSTTTERASERRRDAEMPRISATC